VSRSTLCLWLPAYALLLALVVGGLFYGRAAALRVYGTDAAASQWQTWRSDVEAAQKSPHPAVRRRIPKSTEPPALVLMRDYFPVVLAGSVVLSSVLFATLALFVAGALAQPSLPRRTRGSR
jgi:hypothetical protein